MDDWRLRTYTIRMAALSETPRTDVELRAIASALGLSGGAAPKWLSAKLACAPIRLRPTTAEPDAYRGHMAAALSLGGLLAAFLGCVDLVGEITFAPAQSRLREPAAVDPHTQEAIALVQNWRPAGDEKTVVRRLAAAVRNPAYPRAWSAEKTEEDSYLVIFREPAGTPIYAFEVSLESGAVSASPETVERLTMLRVREATESSDGLVARAR